MNTTDKYLKVCAFAMKRYTKDGILLTHVRGKPTKYERIADAAYNKYIG